MGFFKKAAAVVLTAVFALGCATTALAAREASPTTGAAGYVRAEHATATNGGKFDTRKSGNAYLKKANKTKETVRVNTAKVNGDTYKVTRIMGRAFKGTAATKVKIGANVHKIYKSAFKGSSVKTVVFDSGSFKYTLQSGAFTGVSKIKIKNLDYTGARKLIRRIGETGFKGRLWVYGLKKSEVNKLKKYVGKKGYSCRVERKVSRK